MVRLALLVGTPAGIDGWLRFDVPARSRTTARLLQVHRAGFVPDQDVLPEPAWLADPLMAELVAPAAFRPSDPGRRAGTAARDPMRLPGTPANAPAAFLLPCARQACCCQE